MYTSRASCHVSQNHECRRDNKQCGKAVWFRPAQTGVISAFVGGRDVFVSLPTDYWPGLLLWLWEMNYLCCSSICFDRIKGNFIV